MSNYQPYSNTFHPYKSWLDKLVHVLALRKYNEIVQLPWSCRNDDDDSNRILKDGIQEYRVNISKEQQGMVDGILKKNLKDYENNTMVVPRNSTSK